MTVKWSAFTAGSAIAAANEVVGLQSGVNVRWTYTQVAAFLSTATLAAGTITTSQPMTLTQTWNDGGVTFTALKVNITNTASAAASLLVDLSVGGVPKFTVTRTGAGAFDSDVTSNSAGFIAGGGFNYLAGTASSSLQQGSGAAISWSSTAVYSGSQDLFLVRDAANTLAQRNSTTAQAFRVYNTFTSASVYERLEMQFTGNTAYVASSALGGGFSQRDLKLGGASTFLLYGLSFTDAWKVDNSNGDFLAVNDNARDIGASGASRPRALYVAGLATIGGVITAAAGTATPAAGSTAARLLFGTTAGFGIYYGSDAPTVSAAQGSLYLRSNGDGVANRAYINTNGTTGWTAIATAG